MMELRFFLYFVETRTAHIESYLTMASMQSGMMRLFVRIEGVTPFSLVLQDNLLPEHYVEIATQYYRERQSRSAPDLILIRRMLFSNKDILLDFRRKKNQQKRQVLAPSKAVAVSGGALSPGQVATTFAGVEVVNVYDSTKQADRIRQELVVTDAIPNSLHCETELMYMYVSFHRLCLLLLDPTVSPFLESVFLDTYRQFASPRDVLERCIERYDVPPIASIGEPQRSPLDVDYYRELQMKIRLRVFEFLEHWVEQCFFDFSDDATFQRLRKWASQKVDTDGAPPRLLQLMREGDRTALRSRKPPMMPGVPKRGMTPTSLLAEYSPAEIASQLTLLVMHVHTKIQPVELVGRKWAGPEAADVPNFVAYRDFFSRVSNWAAYAVVAERDAQRRVQNLAALLVLCEELIRLNNWDMVVAVYGGMTEPPVARLKETWSSLPPDVQPLAAKLDELLSTKGSWRNLKEAIRNSAKPHFPCIAAFFRELAVVEEQPIEKDGMVHVYRCIQQHQLIRFLLEGRHANVDMWLPSPEIQGAFSFWRLVDERVLMDWSMEVEPR